MSALGVDEFIVEKPVPEGQFLYLTCKFHMQVRAFHGQPLFATVRLG